MDMNIYIYICIYRYNIYYIFMQTLQVVDPHPM